MRQTILALLLLAAPSFAAECPDGNLCLNLGWVVAQCGGGGEAPPRAEGCAGLPSELLAIDPAPPPGTLWAEVYSRALVPAWEGDSQIRAIFLDPSRDYVRSAALGVLTDHPELCATGEEWAAAAEIETLRRLAARLAVAAAVKRSADGEGGWVHTLLPRTTRCIACAVVFRLLLQEGWLASIDLEAWYSEESALAVGPDVEAWAEGVSVEDLGRTVEP